jgi:carbonic anhydrase
MPPIGGYRGAGGPTHWGDLKSTFKAYSTGQHQSPVNLEATESGHLAPLNIHYKVSLMDLVNNGHPVQENYGKGSYITLGNKRYDLLQFHFHTPSEHRVAGHSLPKEIHFVHRNKRGQLPVVGVLVATDDYHMAAGEIRDRLPTRAHPTSANTRALINARDLLPGGTRHFRYSRSLTTPPCSENVT